MEALGIFIWEATVTIGLAFLMGVVCCFSFSVIYHMIFNKYPFNKKIDCPPHKWELFHNKIDDGIVRYACRKCGRVV